MKLLFIKTLRNLILGFFSVFIIVSYLINPNPTYAADGCKREGQCIDNKKCICTYNGPYQAAIYACRMESNLRLGSQECGSAIIGGVTAPDAISNINSKSGGDIGLIFFLSRAINFANIVAGILVMINFVSSGFLYITGASSASNMSKINQKMMWSIVGILMIIGSYTLAAIFGVVFYGDPTFIINPTITGALELSNTVQ